MKTDQTHLGGMRGPGIFLAQFISDEAPFDSLANIAQWAASQGYKAIQLPTLGTRFIDLERAADSQDYCDELIAICAKAGVVISELSTHLQGQLGSAVDGLSALGSYPAGQDSDYLNSLFARLQDEYNDNFPARDMMMHALVSVLLVWISRQAIQRCHTRVPRSLEYFRRFTQLVEQHYREHPKIEDLAHKLGISVSHLNGTCRELGGQPALQIMHDRQLLEAKRLLTYTSMTINEMSDVLGFSDPTNFSRLFRRRVGFSPKVFREQLNAE